MPKKHSRLFIIRFRIIFPKLLTPCNDDHSHLKVFGDMVRPTFFSVINVEVVFALGITCGHKEESLWIHCIASHIWISYLHIHAEKSSWHFGDWLFCRMQPSLAYLEKSEIWATAPSLGFSLSPNGHPLLFFWPARSGYYGTELCTHDNYILWPKGMNCFHHTLSVEVSLPFFLF